MNKQLRSVALLLLCTMLWGMAFIAQSVGMDHIGPFTFQTVRSFLAVLSLLPLCWITDRFKKDGKTFFSRWGDKKLWKAGIFCGIALFVACNLQQLGIVDTDAGKAAFLTSMYIVFVPILGLLLKRKPSKMIPWCVALAVVGLYCLSCVGVTKINTGDLLLLGCSETVPLLFFTDRDAAIELSARFSATRLQSILEATEAALDALAVNANTRLTMIHYLGRLAAK